VSAAFSEDPEGTVVARRRRARRARAARL